VHGPRNASALARSGRPRSDRRRGIAVALADAVLAGDQERARVLAEELRAIGDNTAQLVEKILVERKHPEHGFRSCLGIIRLDKKYGRDRLEAACARALAVGGRSYSHVNAILQHGLDRAALPTRDAESSAPIEHDNVRGPDYYN